MTGQASPIVSISLVVPILNEAKAVPILINQFKKSRFDEIIVVDGGSTDGSWELLQKSQGAANTAGSNIKIMQSEYGRAKQMNHGASLSKGDVIVFLHADTRLPLGATNAIVKMYSCKRLWGRFDVAFPQNSPRQVVMNIIAFFINVRSRLSGIATGDQAIFVQAELFRKVGGYADLPLMEDVELSKRLKKYGPPFCSRLKVVTSPRRWISNGIVKTVIQMWMYRLAFFVGVPASKLAIHYRNVR